VVLLLAQDNIPVAVDTLEEEDSLAMTEILVEEDIPVAESNLEEDSLAVVYILVEEGNLVVAHTPVVDILEVAFATQPCRIVVAHVDQDLSHAFLLVVVQVMECLLVAVQVVVLLLVDRLAVPGCSYVSPSVLTLVSYLQESCDWHGFHRQ